MNSNRILITGDFVIDHHILKGTKTDASNLNKIGTQIINTYGGARLTHDIFRNLLEKINSESKSGNPIQCFWPFKNIPKLNHYAGLSNESYLQWEIIEEVKELEIAGKKERKKVNVLKLKEKLGFGTVENPRKKEYYSTLNEFNKDTYSTILIDEAGFHYRENPNLWPDFSKATKIILKTTHPLCQGKLWNELLKYRNNLTCIVNLDQIKHYNIKVSNGISWEQTALDIIYGLHKKNCLLNSLLSAKEIVIIIGSAGAILVKAAERKEDYEYQLIYDPSNMENEWEEKNEKEVINKIGKGCTFLAGFLAGHCKSLKTHESIALGLNLMSVCMVEGVFNLTEGFQFEVRNLSGFINNRVKGRNYSTAFVPSPAWKQGVEYLHNSEWSILENNYDNYKEGYKKNEDLNSLAIPLALHGIKSVQYVPRLTFGNLNIIDRNEIENLRNIQKQVEFYDQHEDGKRPLNIAVFGPPGAGKSFLVKVLAQNLFEGKKTVPAFLTFNLSQFRDETELPGAFHAIRDIVLQNKLPIVFWDEFDSDKYKWLKSMISPMQDGMFLEGREVHPIGKAIFVFAGGVSFSMDHFIEKALEEDMIEKKAPDFLSRIACSLNISGLNRKPHKKNNKWEKDGDENDICYSLRRALFIRQILSIKNELLIDPQLLKALIEVQVYKGGARGLERLLKSLSVHSNWMIELSDLPSKEIIGMNVDYDEFIRLLEEKQNDVEEDFTDELLVEKLATGIHNSWLDFQVKDSVFFESYQKLKYNERKDNLRAAQRIKKIIESTGIFAVITNEAMHSKQATSAFDDFKEYIKDEGNLDNLAAIEHEEWKKSKEETNWLKGDRSDYHKKHPCIIPFDKLDEGITERDKQDQKNKDRKSILKYTELLKDHGFVIIKKK